MPRLSHDAYVDHLRRESARFRAVLADCDLTARVPSCPDWDAGDLLWHLGAQVQDFWAGIVEQRPVGPPDDWAEPARPDSDDGLFETFDAATARLVGALAAADPSEEAWTWSSDHTVGFVARRQAHEALIHRLDAELAAGAVTDLDPTLAADGVEECLGVMYGGAPPWGSFTPGTGIVRFDLTDVAESLWVRMGTFTGTDPDSGTTYDDEPDIDLVPDPGSEPDVVVAGPAGPMDAWLWHRGDDAAMSVRGDRGVYERLAAIITQSID
jgi:uncharacterized protein (TIGR03083 family)